MKKRITKKLIKRAIYIHLHMSTINYTARYIKEMYNVRVTNRKIILIDKCTLKIMNRRPYNEINKVVRRGTTVHIYAVNYGK